MTEAESNQSLSLDLVNTRTSITYYVQLRFSTSCMTMEYITSNKGGRKLAFENIIYIKQKVLSNGTVWGDIMGGFCPGGFCPGGFCPRTIKYTKDSKQGASQSSEMVRSK